MTTTFSSIDMTRFDGAIFDLDGVVTKTAGIHADAWKRVFDEFLKRWATRTEQFFQPFDLIRDYRQYVDGKPRNDGVTSFLDSRGISLPYGYEDDASDQDTICGLGNRKDTLFLETLKDQGVEPYQVTLELIRAFRTQGKKTAVVTASKNCKEVLQTADLNHLFDVKVDGWDAEHYYTPGKSSPDGLLKAAKLLDISPPRGVVFEDTPAGVHAGRHGKFGMVIGIGHANHATALYKAGADIVVSDLIQLELCDGDAAPSRSVRAVPSALDLSEKLRDVIQKKRLAIFLDYDGTLTPIVDCPELARLANEMRQIVQALAGHWTVGIISGRDRGEVERLVNIDSLYYAGSHGFDIAGPRGVNIQYEVGTQFLPSLEHAETSLRKQLNHVDGVLIERKKYSIAVHDRLVTPQHCGVVREVVNHVLSAHPALRKTTGKRVYELQPGIDWNKGKALMWLLEALHLSANHVFPIYLGDDLTDEDAFTMLHDRGLGIIVDHTFRFTRAQCSLKNTKEVQQFLENLLEISQSLS